MIAENTASADTTPSRRDAIAKWKAIVAEYQKPVLWRALWQLCNTLGAYALVWWLMYLSLSVSWWLTIPLAILAGGLMIRIFIIFHDCGHGSFFKSPLANDICGFVTGMLTLTPYYHWRWEHSIHHATTGDLDRRGVGDIWTLTVREYLEASRWKRFSYRMARNPWCFFSSRPCFCSPSCSDFPRRRPTPGSGGRSGGWIWRCSAWRRA